MDDPQSLPGWPDRPFSEREARERFADARAVWVMDHGEPVRSGLVDDADPEDAVVELVVETADAFEMYSYTGDAWMDYGTQRRDDPDAPSMAGTLASYRLLAGASTLDVDPDADR